MDNQRVIYTELNLPSNPKKQQRKPKGNLSSILVTEQEITYAELNLQNASQDFQDNDNISHCKDLLSPPEKLIAAILGIICLALIVTMIATVIILSTATKKQVNSFQNTRTQKAYNCSRCPEEWFTYFNSCYYIGNEIKTWDESVMACASMNASLFYIDNEEEVKLLASLLSEAWIGVSRSSSDRPWMSKGSTFKLK
ncbi:NKG2-A/NKG2-B type II integral membrane protein-like [Carlito syrichta]|uniref:NKG2-A/NKG2-B type II integral membrane protein-like n=1 Tax=Carlito syrichta TaxID=1868482 RepID=A0A3Q0DZP5_CARSF|nr:NKG2-A/NKG2-B type II integral membrane protein-like [Carlito syrichta]